MARINAKDNISERKLTGKTKRTGAMEIIFFRVDGSRVDCGTAVGNACYFIRIDEKLSTGDA